MGLTTSPKPSSGTEPPQKKATSRGIDSRELGRGAPVDYREAYRWYRAAADAKHPDACKALAQMHATGRGAKRSEFEEARWSGLAVMNTRVTPDDLTRGLQSLAEKLLRGKRKA